MCIWALSLLIVVPIAIRLGIGIRFVKIGRVLDMFLAASFPRRIDILFRGIILIDPATTRQASDHPGGRKGLGHERHTSGRRSARKAAIAMSM